MSRKSVVVRSVHQRMTRKLLGFAAVGVVALGAPAAAMAHVSAEGKLRAEESAALGAEHAAAHARQRELAAQARTRRATAPRRAAPRAVSNAIGGAWSDAQPLPVIAINAILLPTGKILMFAYPARPGYGDSDYAKAYVWNPANGTSTAVDPPIDPDTNKPTNIWCGGASLLADGRVLITGGNVDDPTTDFHGINRVFTFNPFKEQWDPPATNADMAQGRWYPSQVLMPGGRSLVVGGLTRPGDADFGVGNNTDNDLEIISPNGTVERQPGFFNGAGDPPLSGLYPRIFWMPSGRALAAGPFAADTWLLSPGSPGAVTSWSDVPNPATDREWGAAVLLPGGRVMRLGGSRLDADDPAGTDGKRPAQSTTEIFDENQPAAGWQPAAPMQVGRSHANSVLLPDATVATVGGGLGEDSGQEFYRWLYSEDDKRVELFDPGTNTTVLGNAQAEARTYHSTALLLPDGRVMSAGDDINGPGGAATGTTSDTAEIYSPPYLFKGPRPVLGTVSSWAGLGDQIEVTTSGPPARKAVLVAPGAATHGVDMSQRRILLAAPTARPGGRIALRMPANANVAVPGYYMLFLLSDEGVPSLARFIRIDATRHLPPPINPVFAPPPAPESKLVLKLNGKLPRMSTVRRTRRFGLTVQVSEPGKVRLSARLERGTKPALFVTTTRTMTFKAAGTRRVTFTLTRAGLRRLKARRRGVLRIRAKVAFASGRTLPAVQVRRNLR